MEVGLYVYTQSFKIFHTDCHKFCKDNDFEVCTILLEISYTKILAITIYTSPSSDFQLFLNRMDVTIKCFSKSNLILIRCGDMNVNYCIDTDSTRQLGSVLNSYNLFNTIHFPTSNQNGSNTETNNIFIDTFAFTNCKIIAIINRL
jgi:hypothetical protein